MIRLLDIVLSILALFFLMPLMIIVWVVAFFDTGSPIFRQIRLGQLQKPFTLLKFRTMSSNTPSAATHLVDPQCITRFGSFLRKSKLDELPQLWNVFKGEMSLVGPRPCLPNQVELIHERDRLGIFAIRPGVTGLAQIQGVDMSKPKELSSLDAQLIDQLTVRTYIYLLWKTMLGAGFGDRVRSASTDSKSLDKKKKPTSF